MTKPRGTLVQRTAAALTEASLSRVFSHWSDAGFAIVSAGRGERTPEENAKWYKRLRSAVRRDGFGFIPLVGYWHETDTGFAGRQRL